jgi:hypothetical protein
MDELTVYDNGGNGEHFTLSNENGDANLRTMAGDVGIDTSDAVSMISWLEKVFHLEQAEQLAGFSQSLTITTPDGREVSWMGDTDAPAWLQRVATGAPAESDGYFRMLVMGIRKQLDERSPVNNPEGTGVLDRVVELLDAYDRRKREAEENYFGWRKLIGALGTDDHDTALSMAVEFVKAANLLGSGELVSRINALKNEHARSLRQQAIAFDASMRTQHENHVKDAEQSVQLEREARAKVQARLENAEDALRKLHELLKANMNDDGSTKTETAKSRALNLIELAFGRS